MAGGAGRGGSAGGADGSTGRSGGDTRRFEPAGPLSGELRVPGDKSISHRAALLGAMSEGEVRIAGYLDSADTRSTLAAIQALGAAVRDAGGSAAGDPGDPGASDANAGALEVSALIPQVIAIRGVGLRGAAPATIDVGNAGTLIRLLPGWLAGQPEGGCWRLTGDDSIRRRPMGRVVEPLRRMGARIEPAEGEVAPLDLESGPLRGIAYDSPLASAQVKSCLLLAGLLAEGPTTVREPRPSRDHTERMLAAAGVKVERLSTPDAAGEPSASTVSPVERLQLSDLEVPGDISSAAFFLVAATLVEGSEVLLRGVGVNPTRTGVLDVLARMGADIQLENEADAGGEPVADLRARSAALNGTEIGGAEIPRAIDELPIIALAAACAEGRTVIRDAAELRRKESDRIATVAAALSRLGVQVEATEDGMIVHGRSAPAGAGGASLTGGTIESHGDHRIAMLGAVAGILAPGGVTVRDMSAAAISYPSFEQDLSRLIG